METPLFKIWADPKPYPLSRFLRSNFLTRLYFYEDRFQAKLFALIPIGTRRTEDIKAFSSFGSHTVGLSSVWNGIMLTYSDGKKELLSIYGKENSEKVLGYFRRKMKGKEEKSTQ